MKRLMFVVLVVLIGSGFIGGIVGCQDEKATPPAKPKMGKAFPLSAPVKGMIPPQVKETTPKGENAPVPGKG
jgi:hypothetical protein